MRADEAALVRAALASACGQLEKVAVSATFAPSATIAWDLRALGRRALRTYARALRMGRRRVKAEYRAAKHALERRPLSAAQRRVERERLERRHRDEVQDLLARYKTFGRRKGSTPGGAA